MIVDADGNAQRRNLSFNNLLCWCEGMLALVGGLGGPTYRVISCFGINVGVFAGQTVVEASWSSVLQAQVARECAILSDGLLGVPPANHNQL